MHSAIQTNSLSKDGKFFFLQSRVDTINIKDVSSLHCVLSATAVDCVHNRLYVGDFTNCISQRVSLVSPPAKFVGGKFNPAVVLPKLRKEVLIGCSVQDEMGN